MVTLKIFLITLSINFNAIIYYRKKNSDGQKEAKLCFSSIYRKEKKSTIDRNIYFHARTVGPRKSFLFSNQRSNPSSVVERDYL